MARRAGIEISATRCAIVDVDLPRQRSARGAVRVRTFKTIPWGPDTPATLAGTLRRMRASKMVSNHVVVATWGVRSAHQVMSLPPAKPADLHALALREAKKTVPLLANEGESSSGLLLDGGTNLPGSKRDVTLVAVSAADVRARLAPIVAAGFTVDAVVTVPVALASLARRLHPHAAGARAYVAVNGDATAVAIVRHGLLVFAREIPLTFSPAAMNWQAAQKTEFADRLAAELKRSFLFYKQQSKLEVEQVFVCGEFPDVRALTAPLIHALDVEVETLDSMEGLGPATPARSAVNLRDRAGELRVAWAAAADRSHAVNLLPVDVAAGRDSLQLYRRVGLGLAASILLLAVLYGLAQAWAGRATSRVNALRQDVARLEPQLQQMEQAQRERARNVARAAMLEAAAAQGPRLSRVLEVLGRSVGESVVLDGVAVRSDGATWPVGVRGRSVAPDAATAQSAFNQFLRLASASPYLGPPLREPTLRVLSDPAGTLAEESGAGGMGVDRVAGGVVTRPSENLAPSAPPGSGTGTRAGEADLYGDGRVRPVVREQRWNIRDLWWFNPRVMQNRTYPTAAHADWVRQGLPSFDVEPGSTARTAGPKQAAERGPQKPPLSLLDFGVQFGVKK
jgi:Tfp pilus assembly PilM family ATPase/Tfp pilus assembly protein PilN